MVELGDGGVDALNVVANGGGGIVLVEVGKPAGAILKKFPELVLQDRFRRLACAAQGARKSVPASSMSSSRGKSRARGDRGSLVGAAACDETEPEQPLRAPLSCVEHSTTKARIGCHDEGVVTCVALTP